MTITPAATLLVTCGGIARSGWWLIASAVVGGDKVAADHQAIRRHVADLDIVLVRAERPEQRAHELHPPVVGPPQPLGDITVAPRPVPDR